MRATRSWVRTDTTKGASSGELKVLARYVEALGGRLDLVADFGDRTIQLPVSDTATRVTPTM